MKSNEGPPRLVEHPEYGQDWAAAAGDDFEAERLARCGGRISAEVAGLSAGAGLSGAGATGLLTVAKVVAPILLVGGLLAAYLAMREPASVIPVAQEPQPVIQEREPDKTPVRPVQPKIVQPPPADAPESEKRAVRPAPKRPKPKRRKIEPQQPAPAKLPEPESPVVKEAPSALPQQLALFDGAKRLAKDGKLDAALTKLDELERRFPESHLRREARLARADYLVQGNRPEEAAVQIQRLLLQSDFSSKRPVLLQLLGDSWMKRGRCDRARGAYRKALGAGLNKKRANMVRLAIKKCELE